MSEQTEKATVLESVVYDDHGLSYRVTIRGVRVWFGNAEDRGDERRERYFSGEWVDNQ